MRSSKKHPAVIKVTLTLNKEAKASTDRQITSNIVIPHQFLFSPPLSNCLFPDGVNLH